MCSRCPVRREQHHKVMMVTGYDEALVVYHHPDLCSSGNSVAGPFPGFPVPLEGRDDVCELIEQYRDGPPMSDHDLEAPGLNEPIGCCFPITSCCPSTATPPRIASAHWGRRRR